MPYEYEHFDPPFEEALEHRAEGIALLCPTHHADKTAGRLSVETVRRARRTPHNRSRSALWAHHLTEDRIALDIAGNVLHGQCVGLSINDSVVIGIRAPANSGGLWLVTGSLADPTGRQTLKFYDNQVEIRNGSWDVTMQGTTLTVRNGPKEIVAQVAFAPTDRVICLERLKMRLGNGHSLIADASGISIDGPDVKIELGGNAFHQKCGSAIVFGEPSAITSEFATLAINYPILGSFVDWHS